MIFVKAKNTHDLRNQLHSMFPEPSVDYYDYSDLNNNIIIKVIPNGITIDIPKRFKDKKILIQFVD